VPKDRAAFDVKFTDILDDSFLFSSPVGVPDGKAATADFVFSQWGTRYEDSWAARSWVHGRDMRILLTNVTTAWSDDAACAAASHFQEHSAGLPACTVLFHENQQVGGPSGPVQAKANSATLRCGSKGELIWILEQETWWPGISHGLDSCKSLAGRGLTGEAAPACDNCTHCLQGHCSACLRATTSAMNFV